MVTMIDIPAAPKRNVRPPIDQTLQLAFKCDAARDATSIHRYSAFQRVLHAFNAQYLNILEPLSNLPVVR